MRDETQNYLDKTGEYAKRAGKYAAKKAGKALAQKARVAILKIIGPYLPIIFLILIIIGLLYFIVGAVFSSTPQGKLFTGPEYSLKDEELIKFYKKVADKNNKRDRWLVPYGRRKDGKTWLEAVSTDIIIKEKMPQYYDKVLKEEDIRSIALSGYAPPEVLHYYHVKEKGYMVDEEGKTIYPHELTDHYGKDRDKFGTFGRIHSGSVFHMLTFNEEHTAEKFKEKTGEDYRPFLYYKPSTIQVTHIPKKGEPSTTVTGIFLLVESDSLNEHTIYDYKQVTHSSSDESGTTIITLEEPNGETQIRQNPWQRLDDWVKENYELRQDQEEIETARTSVWEAGIGYTDFKERLEWLFSGKIGSFYITEGFVPSNLMSNFSQVGQHFNIPSWFLAALAYKESSFDPQAQNSSTGAYGLFQLTETERKWTVDQLVKDYPNLLPPSFLELYKNSEKNDGFYVNALSDPLVSTLAGCLVFIAKADHCGIDINEIDWEGDRWKDQVLPILAMYGGFSHVPERLWGKYGIKNETEAKEPKNIQAWCKDEYASSIFNMAEKLQVQKILPIDGVILLAEAQGGDITSFFGYRIHPTTGERQFHEGIDIKSPIGTPVKAVTNAKVIFADYLDDISGNMVTISNDRYRISYCHLSRILVSKNDIVTPGKILGEVGSTGRSTGPHLHFEIREISSSGNNYIDPLVWLTSGLE